MEKPNDHTHTTHPLAKVGRRLSQQREEPTKHPTSGDEYQKVQQLLGTLLPAYRPGLISHCSGLIESMDRAIKSFRLQAADKRGAPPGWRRARLASKLRRIKI